MLPIPNPMRVPHPMQEGPGYNRILPTTDGGLLSKRVCVAKFYTDRRCLEWGPGSWDFQAIFKLNEKLVKVSLKIGQASQ